MREAHFNNIIEARCQDIRGALARKAVEYARDDRLSNFKKVAAFRNKEPEEVLMGMAMKHIAALDDFIQDLPGKLQPKEYWNEKIRDTINYMILLEALLEDRRDVT